MDINRNNYEEYFLLYADDELTDSEKAEVLMFLKENKDLEAEFRMIHQTICKPDAAITLADKSFLLKGNEEPFINEKNYEEIFVLYHDHELTAAQKKETEDFLSRHENLKSDFDLIGLARLVPEDAVIFPNKKVLYKKEKDGKVVPIIFWRALAAAVVIGFGFWITERYISKDTEKGTETVQSVPAKKTSPLPAPNKVTIQKQLVNTVVQSAVQNPKPVVKNNAGEEKSQKILSQKDALDRSLVKIPARKQEAIPKSVIHQSPAKAGNEDDINDNIAIANEKIKNIASDEIPGNSATSLQATLGQDAITEPAENVQPVVHAQPASYFEDTNDKNQNYVFYNVTTDEFRKTKVGGFLKKVKRVIERNNPISRLLSGDEKQVVSN